MRLVVAAGLHGAFRLARGRADGLVFVESTPEGALRSFWAAAICLPAYLALRLFGWASGGGPAGGSVGRALVVELIGYGIGWVAFALASRPVAEALGRLADWPRFVAAWNWSNVVQHLAMLGAAVPAALGLPGAATDALGLVVVGYALWLEWFVAREALRVTGGRAAAFVVLDVALALFLHGLLVRLTIGG
jgi:hypothetical protein